MGIECARGVKTVTASVASYSGVGSNALGFVPYVVWDRPLAARLDGAMIACSLKLYGLSEHIFTVFIPQSV